MTQLCGHEHRLHIAWVADAEVCHSPTTQSYDLLAPSRLLLRHLFGVKVALTTSNKQRPKARACGSNNGTTPCMIADSSLL